MKSLKQKVLTQIIFHDVPARAFHSVRLKKNIHKLASVLKDDCFEDIAKLRADVDKDNHGEGTLMEEVVSLMDNNARVNFEKDNQAEVTLMVEVASLVVNKARLNLKDMRLPHPSLKQKHTLSNIIALRGGGVPINHCLSLDELVGD